MADTAYQRIRAELEKLGPVKTFGTDRLMARCPAHEDHNPSLSVRGIEGQALVYCHAGCEIADIVGALGLTMRDLYDEDRAGNYGRFAYATSYRYDNGRTVYRSADKQFRQGGTDNPPELYQLAEVVAGVAAGKPVIVTEGEKDADAARAQGYTATCCPMGAGKWPKVDPTPLYGANVIVVADNDEPGMKHAADIVASLAGHATVSVFRAAEGKDFADHVAAGHTMADLVPITLPTIETAAAATEPERVTDRMIDGGAFILDAPTETPSLWGAGEQVVWARGEALMIGGPAGVGKTTLEGQLIEGSLTGAEVLGMPVVPTHERVLMLAMDRPMQARRALRRTLAHLGRDLLAERLVFWQGPPPADVAKHPEVLLELAEKAGADRLFVDSLKDAAIGLSDDEVGAGYNRARQLCLANGVEVVELHHLVKRGSNGAKPNTLADVYGSTWLTAGAGSVVLLWGAAGDPIVELHHLKQPAEEFGPCRIIHDHERGRSEVWHATDLVTLARAAGTAGITAKAAAAAVNDSEKLTPAQIEKARRKLNGLVKKGLLYRIDGDDAAQRPTVWTSAADPHAYPHAPIPGVTPSREPHGLTDEPVTAGQQPSRIPSRPSRAGTLTIAPPPVRRGQESRCLVEGCDEPLSGSNFCEQHAADPNWGGVPA